MKDPQLLLTVHQQDWMPGFAAFHDNGKIRDLGHGHITLNLGAILGTVEAGHVAPSEVPYFVAESIMHEVIHALEAWAGVEFSEERVEALLERYREYIRDQESQTQTP